VDAFAHPGDPRGVRAARCPGCGTPIRFDLGELFYDGPEVKDVMCALCGTIADRDRLLAEAFDVAA
jgi:hypothetical protein